jgi:hypothetical protein
LRVTLREFAFVELSHWVLLAVTSFIYLRVRGVARRWTVVSTGILLGSGALLSQSQHGRHRVVSWLPLALLATEHAVDRRTALSGAAGTRPGDHADSWLPAAIRGVPALPDDLGPCPRVPDWRAPLRVLLVLAEGLVTALCCGR